MQHLSLDIGHHNRHPFGKKALGKRETNP